MSHSEVSHTEVSHTGEWESRDRDLLMRYRPILRLAEGERFLPMAVDPYIGACSLHVPDSEDPDRTVVKAGELTNEDLARPWPVGSYLRFVDADDASTQLPERMTSLPRGLASGYRLTRVGLFGRIVDSLIRFVNVFRPTVPWRTSDAAAVKAQSLQNLDGPCCYGRVVREGGWLALHYTFFYAMNDWRSRFRGINDHESDWEQILVYLDANDESPRWAAYASHDHAGDDLRRRWDDPELEVAAGRPVVYVGAGSHASYFTAGEYTTGVHVRALGPVLAMQRFFRRLLKLPADVEGLDIPYIDQAPGDGMEIGPSGSSDLSLRPLDSREPWVGTYRGLWGLDTHDPVDGERAPGGPMYERDGSIRKVWADPLGWAGMHKVIAPSQESDTTGLAEKELERLNLELNTLIRQAHLLGADPQSSPVALEQVEDRILTVHREQILLAQLGSAATTTSAWEDDARAHLANPAFPNPPTKGVRQRLLNFWATISTACVLALFGVTALAPSDYRWQIAVFGMLAILLIELLTKRRFLRALLVWAVALILAILVWAAWVFLSPPIRVVIAAILFVMAGVVLCYNLLERLQN